MPFLKNETFATRSHAGFPTRSGLERRLKHDPLVDTLCEKVVVEDSNERISALSRNGEIPVTRGCGEHRRNKQERAKKRYVLCAMWWKDLGRI